MSTLDEALRAARGSTEDTLFVLVSPKQAHRLMLALEIADMLVKNDPEDINGFAAAVSVYKELSK